MKTVIRAFLFVAVVATVPLSLWATYKSLAFGYESLGLGKRPSPPPPPALLSPPKLSARAGDGDTRLTWSVPSDQLPLVDQWEFEQSGSGVAETHSTGSNGAAYLVAGLTNGVTYSFRVRAILRAGASKVASWSNMVSATPMQVGDVLERMERHQRGMERHQWRMARQQEEMARAQGRIADSASAVADLMAENSETFQQLADRGINALETLAASSGGTSQGLADIREAIGTVAGNIGEITDGVAVGLPRIGEAAENLPPGSLASRNGWGGRRWNRSRASAVTPL